MNTYLIKIFNSLKSFLNRLLEKKDVKLLESPKQDIETQKFYENSKNITELNKSLEKQRIMQLYKLIKENDINMMSIEKNDLIKIRYLLFEELKLNIEKNNEEEIYNKNLEIEINQLSKNVTM